MSAAPTIRPRVSVAADREGAERLVAEAIVAEIVAAPRAVLGLATGRTMLGVYRRLAEAHQRRAVGFSGVTTFNLDEYCDLAPASAASFRTFMARHLFDRVDIDPEHCHFPSLAADGAPSYDDAIAACGGIDLQLLGIGRNGHIGFNEPGSPGDSGTRIVALSPSTLAANAHDFPPGDAVPERAATMGVATILRARRILLLATGEAKAEALASALEGPVGPHNPASFLRGHRDVTIVCDRAAAANLARHDQREDRHART